MTEQRNYRVYEVTIREQVILHTTFRVAVDAEGELDEEATLEGHINDSPAYLYSLDKDGNIFPNYYAEVEDIDDEEPVLTDVVELKENQKRETLLKPLS